MMSVHLSSASRRVLAVAAALFSVVAPATATSASSGGTDAGEIAGSFSYAQTLPTAPACAGTTWNLSASGAAVAGQASAGTSSGVDSFFFAGTTDVSASGVSSCANGVEDLLGTLSLSIVSSGSAGTLNCSGSGRYVRAAAAFFSELGMDCTFGGKDLGTNLVTLVGTLVPTDATLSGFAFQGSYLFDLSSVQP